MNRAAAFDALVTAMKTGVTFGGLAVGASFHFPARPESVYVKVSPRRFRHRPDVVTGGRASFTTGGKTAVVLA